MTGYSIISTCALTCYLLLFVAFLASKKTKLINSFIFLLAVLTTWTLGSFCMRCRFAPGLDFWFYISISSLFMLIYAYFVFIANYTDAPRSAFQYPVLGCSIAIIVINIVTKGVFIGAPKEVTEGDQISFVYNTDLKIIIPFIYTALVLVLYVVMIRNYVKKNLMAKQQLIPVITGVMALVLGNVLASFPMFASFPIDILSGIVNAICIMYALYSRKLFRLTLLVSKSVLYFVSGVLAILLIVGISGTTSVNLLKYLKVFGDQQILAAAIIYVLFALIFYFVLKKFVDHVFIKTELTQANDLKEFSTAITRTLKVDEIMSRLISIIETTVHTEKTYICLKDEHENCYRIMSSSSPLDGNALVIKADNPLITYLERYKDCILMEDLKRATVYKAMWDKEKQNLKMLNIQCILPLINENELVGLVLLSNKEKNVPYTINDQSYLQSLASVSSVAIKNSWLYEKVYREARTDNLTGLLNRKYFHEVLEETFNANPRGDLALIYISVDSFKLYNKLYGTVEGDKALQNIANIISASVGANGQVARYEGKTFMVILPGYDVLGAVKLADKIREQIMNLNSKDKEYSMKMLTASCGVCAIPTGAANPNQLISNVDLALYNAKRSGKNSTRSHSEGPALSVNGGQAGPGAETIPGVSDFSPRAFDQYEVAINSLTKAIDIKDHYTYGHCQNVCYYSTELSKAYGLDQNCVEIVREAALLHDIGKIGIDERILCKPDKLTDEEYAIMKRHVEQSIEIVKQLPSLSYVIPAIIGHHERFDGKGYPRGLKGEEIPLLARILCVADSFDAMISKRSYKKPMEIEYALNELENNSGTQFDPNLVKLFVKMVKDGDIQLRKSNNMDV